MDVDVSPVSRPAPRPVVVRSAMGGFFLLGCLMALMGALLPVWVYLVHFSLATAGNYFLAFNLGILAASIVSRKLMARLGLRRLLVSACCLAGGAMLILGAIVSPVALIPPLICLGFATGMLTTGLSWLMSDAMTAPMGAAILSLAGVFFGCGAVCVTLLVRAWVHSLSGPGILSLAAVLPLGLGLLYLRRIPLESPALRVPSLHLSLRGALLSLALVFQSGNEWAVGGWLALYWIRRLGVSSRAALLGLAIFWTTLTLGKLLVPRLPCLRGSFRLLTAAAGAALFGCLLLFSTAGVGGAVVGVLFLGAGLGATYPLLIGMIGERFPYYHPGFFNGLFSLALIGGMLMPWSVGQLADAWVIDWVIGVPALGSVLVYLLLSILVLEARVARITKTASSN